MRSAKNRLPLPHFSIRVRLTCLFVAIFGFTLIAFSTILYTRFVRTQQEEFDASLYNHAVDVTQSIEVDFFGDLSLQSKVLSEGEKLFPFALGKAFLQIRDLSGHILVRSRGLKGFELPFDGTDQRLLSSQKSVFNTIDVKKQLIEELAGRRYRLLSYRMDRGPSAALVLQIAVPMNFLENENRAMQWFFLFSIPLVLIFSGFGGLFLSRHALAPVGAIIAKTRELGAARLTERVPVPRADDEIRQLALTLNGLLERLQQAFDSQERFVADASHQLRTPLAVLRGELDLMRSKPRSPEELQQFLDSSSQEIDYLSRMVEDLLMLARVDAGKASLSIEPVRLDEVVLESVSRLERYAVSRGVKVLLNLSPESSYEMRGDPELLQCLLRNLIENAVKYSPSGTTVEVRAEERGEHLAVEVRDQGTGIAPAELARIFERFYRAGSASLKSSGLGLGLPIARRIAEAHGGEVTVDSKVGRGTVFTVILKKN